MVRSANPQTGSELNQDTDAADEPAVVSDVKTSDDDTKKKPDCDCLGEVGCECDDEEAADAEGEEGAAKSTSLGAKFIAEFGETLGGCWFASGLSFSQAQAKFGKHLLKENQELRRKVERQAAMLSAMRQSFDGELDQDDRQPTQTEPISGRQKFAASLNLG